MQSRDYPDYSLSGKDAKNAFEKGLVDAAWYQCHVPKEKMLQLLERKNGPGIRDTLIWFTLLIASGVMGYVLWGTYWAIIPFFIYGVFYGTAADSRWHECNHGTAFKSDWMNRVVYEMASFMVVRESVLWRWTHVRHHSDTLITGSDPEIAAPRPPQIRRHIMNMFNLGVWQIYIKSVTLHALGKTTEDDRNLVPESEHTKLFLGARIIVAIYASVIGLSIYTGSFLPLMYIGLPSIYGAWLMPIYSLTQHSGLKENVLDHRENCRTIYMNLVNRFIYWNMNYHLEHHMFPLVPYYSLPQLHEAIKEDCPKPYNGLLASWKEILPAWAKQKKDPSYYVPLDIPEPSSTRPVEEETSKINGDDNRIVNGWIEICDIHHVLKSGVIRFDYKDWTYAVYRTNRDEFYASDGLCTHGNSHLSDGMLVDGVIECAKHNGRFDLKDGAPVRSPVCIALNTYEIKAEGEKLWLSIDSIEQVRQKSGEAKKRFKVVSNENVSTYIKELVLEPLDKAFDFRPGEYIQLEIPVYQSSFKKISVSDPYKKTWDEKGHFDHFVANRSVARRNYSLASNPSVEKNLRFNIRIALPPEGSKYDPGVGSTYAFQLVPGETVNVYGPFGDFHIKEETQDEMVYIGGGAGMAPLRSHISYLLETQKTTRKISFWYGARTANELFYQDYFEDLAKRFSNFEFHYALSDSKDVDSPALKGFIHEVYEREHLKKCDAPKELDFYLCGPPAMISACLGMLNAYKISSERIAYDEF